jgi:hypothetical protein
VYEEAGLLLDYDKVAYKLSQPWPFPASLMIGCVATMHEAEIQRQKVSVDYHELDEARWFDVKEVAAMLARSTQVPPRSLAFGLGLPCPAIIVASHNRKGRRRVSCTCHRRSRSRIIWSSCGFMKGRRSASSDAGDQPFCPTGVAAYHPRDAIRGLIFGCQEISWSTRACCGVETFFVAAHPHASV